MAKRGKVRYLPKQTLDEMEKIMLSEDINVGSEALRKMASYSQIGRELKKNMVVNREVNKVLKKKRKKDLWKDLEEWVGGMF